MAGQDGGSRTAVPAGATIRAGELEVGYIDAGSGVPLVLVHGGRSDRTQFAPLRANLGEGIRVISYDQRDSGITVNPPDQYTMDDLGDDLVALLDALDLPSAHVLGTSFGGAVAQHAALRHPERIASLILVCTTPSFALGGDALDELLEMSHADLQNAVADFFLTPEGQAKLGSPTGAARALTPRDAEQAARRNVAARQHEIRDRLGDITAPTLIVHGTEDRLAPYSGALLMEQRIPNARLRSIEGGRHGIQLEFPDRIAHWVREFLFRDGGTSGATHTGVRHG